MNGNKLMVNANSKEILDNFLFNEVCDLNITDAKRILGVTASSRIVSVEALNNELRMGVRTVFCAIYENMESEFMRFESGVDSIRSIIREGIEPATESMLSISVLDNEFTGTGLLRCKSTVEISGWFQRKNTLSFLDANCADLLCKTASVKVESVEMLRATGLTLTTSNEARLPVSKILDYQTTVFVNNVYPAGGVYQLDGEVSLRIIAITDNGQFLSQSFGIPFSTEVNDEAVSAHSVIDVEPAVRSVTLTLSDGDSRTFISDIELSLRASMTEGKEIEGVVDVYSISNELTIERSSCKMDVGFCYRAVHDKVTGVSKVSGVNEILCVSAPMVGGAGIMNRNGLIVEGVLSANVIFRDESNDCQRVLIEMPYLTSVASEYECGATMTPTVSITSVSARIRTSTEIEVTAEIRVLVRGVSEREVSLIADIETGALKEEDNVAISLYIVKPSESLWEVAKALNSTEETLMTLNPELKLPLKGGERVLLYQELQFEIE